MGACASCQSAVKPILTTKLILENGELKEFSYPIKVSYLLQQDPTVFVCNSDDMEFEGFLTAVRDDEELQLGQLYFVLPLSMLKRKLHAEEMAALAVKASSALMKSIGVGGGKKCGGYRSRCVAPVMWCEVDEVKEKVVVAERQSGCGGRKSGGNGRGKRRFTANLSAIPEDK